MFPGASHHVGWIWGIEGGHESEIETRLRSHPGFTISQNAPLPFERDGRRKLYDRPPANAARFRDIINGFDLPSRMPAPELDGGLKKDTLTFKGIYSTRNYVIAINDSTERLMIFYVPAVHCKCIQLVSHFFIFSRI